MIKKNTIYQRLLASMLSIMVAMMFSFTADAASSCKGKTKSACSADSNCSWVSGFKRKDGVKVSGHCRASAGKANKDKTKQKSESKAKKDKSAKSKDKESNNDKSVDEKEKKSKDKKVKKEKKKKSKDKKSSKDTTTK